MLNGCYKFIVQTEEAQLTAASSVWKFKTLHQRPTAEARGNKPLFSHTVHPNVSPKHYETTKQIKADNKIHGP